MEGLAGYGGALDGSNSSKYIYLIVNYSKLISC